MPNDLIKIDNSNLASAPFANDLIGLHRVAQTFYQLLVAIDNQMSHTTDNATFTTLEAKYGIPVNNGTTIKTLVNALNTSLTSDANFRALIDRVA